ncbi:MAG: type II CRISPR-associated endonuclease Cas1, partial [Candidatus Heimdallarchaeota archaeon]
MIKQILDISEKAYIHLKNKQFVIDKNGTSVAQIPIEDIGIVLLEHPGIILSQALISACSENNTVLVFCDKRHLPISIITPLTTGHTKHTKIIANQINVSTPLKKKIWKIIVREKISQQILHLEQHNIVTTQLKKIRDKVKSGDKENHEAQAAQRYWKLLFGKKFQRRDDENTINNLLNYGYSVIRAMIARSIVGSGLHPSLGIHHHNQYNGLCLADDIMEPLRPWVDFLVYKITLSNSNATINKNTKQ